MEIPTNSLNVLFSLILGLTLSSLFYSVCKDGNCVIKRAKPLEEVENTIFKHDSKCYRYKAQSTTCSNKVSS